MSERSAIEQYLHTVRHQGWFRRTFTEITWTPKGVRINEQTYETLREVQVAIGKYNVQPKAVRGKNNAQKINTSKAVTAAPGKHRRTRAPGD